MCGIAGIMTRDGSPSAPAILDRMVAAIGHRGPDGEGRYAAADTAFAQTRLAIIDLETGDQPLYAESGRYGSRLALVANGEIYNYVELKQTIAGAEFQTRSDCETPLHLYRRDGIDFAQSLRGMYAIAIHDPAEGQLVLARDPFGIKPLYYGVTGDGFVFASELQAFLAAGIAQPKVSAAKCQELLQLQFTTGAETPLEGIYRVLPGETLVVRRGEIEERLRLGALPPLEPKPVSKAEALDELDRVLEDSVNVHQRSDVPYGMFLSGGVDSSALLAMMARLNDEPVHAFTAGFPGTQVHDERDHARMLAARTGAHHTEVSFGEEDFWTLLPEIAAAIDDPVADYAVLPTYKLGRAAREAGLKVVLSGEGGDEMFAGYGRYRRALRPRLLGGRDMREKGAFDGLDVLAGDGGVWREGLARVRAELPAGLTRLQELQAVDCADWLPNDLLIKLDRCLMAHGVEGRVPFLDPKVADFAYRLPDSLKVRRGSGKWLLRAWLDEHLPEARAFTGKRGFTVPVGEWISAKASRLGPLVAGQPGIQEACRTDAVRGLFASLGGVGKAAGHAAWTLLFYALWHDHHVVGRRGEGGVLDRLAA